MIQNPVAEQLFVGNSEMAKLMRSLDWSQTPLGEPLGWSQSLKTVLSILLTSQHPIFLWWGKELIQFYNDAYRPILGTTKHPQALGQQGRECWKEIWHVIEPMIEAVMQRGEATRIQDGLLILERNGYLEECYFNYAYSPVRDENSKVGGIFCACDETTKRVLGERQLRTLRELAAQPLEAKTVENACHLCMSAIANNLADLPFALLYLIDDTGTSAQLMGTAGIELGTMASPEQIQIAKHSWDLNQVKLMGQTQYLTDLATRFDSLPESIWNISPQSAIVVPLNQSGQQQLAGFLILAVSPRRAFNDEYRGFFEVVASQVETALSNARAYEEEHKQAEVLAELDRAKTAFFSNVSHEFRTPLTLMLSPLEDLVNNLDGAIPPQEREQLQRVQRNGMRLLKLVNSLLDFSRIEAGRVQASYEPVNLSTFTAELASAFRSLIEQAGMSLIVECPLLPEAIYIDREMWEKIVLNLLSNAFKFTFKFTLAGSITVRLQWLGAQVELSVADTGVGIPPEELPHLFERFHRVKNSQGRSFEGSGIGLSLVQELVKLQGGTIKVSSTFGQGSCFTVSIPTGTASLPKERMGASRPLASTALNSMPYVEEAQRWLTENNFGLPILEFELEEGSPALSVPERVNQPAQSKTENRKFKILLADDNADMRDYIRRLLSASYTVQSVSDGVAALAAIRSNPPDLVLTDVMMPGMDGFELLRSLRSNSATQDLPIILLSARAGEESRIEGLTAGADDYLIKPFSARELIARVEATLKLAQLRRTAREREQALQVETQVVKANLDQSEEKYRTLFESLDEGLCICEMLFDENGKPADYRFLEVNPVFSSLTGLEQATGKTARELVPNLEAHWFEIYGRVVQTGEPIRFENQSIAMNRWFDVNAFRIREPQSNQFAVLFTNITDRKQTEIALQESEERLRVAQFGAKTGTWDWNLAAGNIIWSPEYYALFGINPAIPPTYENWLATVLEADRAAVEQAVREALQQKQTHLNFEFRICHPTQGILWFGSRSQIFYDSDGQPTRAIGISIDVTARKLVEEALRQSEEKSRTILESITDAFLALDENWRYTYVNATAEALLYRSPGYLVGKNLWEEYPGLIGSEFELLYRRVAEEGVAGSTTAFYPDHDRWYEVRVYPVANGITVYFSDVTDRIRSAEALQQTSAELERQLQKFDAIASSVPDFIYTFDLAGRFTYVNPAMLYLWEKTSAEALGKNFLDLDYPTDLANRLQRQIKEVIETRQPIKDETPYTSASGTRDYEYIFVPLFDANGTVEAVAGVTRDITERKQIEEALRESEQRFRNMADNAPMMVWVTDPTGYCTYLSRSWYDFSGQTAANGLGFGWLDATHPEDRELSSNIFLTANERQEAFQLEYRLLRKDGAYRVCIDAARPWFGPNGEFKGYIGSVIDIDDRKQAEAILAERARELANLNSLLAQSASLLEERNQELDRFVYIVSHDLKAPLRAISNLSQWIEEDLAEAPSADTQEQMGLLRGRVHRMEAMINGLLDYARVGRRDTAIETVSVEELLTEVIDSVAPPPTFQITIGPEMPTLQTKRLPLSQVFSNLISNAIKHHGRPDGSIQIGCHEQGDFYKFTVADDGPGIASEHHDRIFMIFQALNPQHREDSSGIGLSIVKKIVETEEGTIRLESQIGKGTTFYFTWPK